MKKSYNPSSLIGGIVFLFLIFSSMSNQAQVGIGTTNPNASSALDISSTTQGLLLPRMTTAQRSALSATAANSLMVYDTDLKSFYYFDATALPAPGTWIKINAAANQRDNYKLVKSVADLAPELIAGGGNNYKLSTNTYYEINGLITLAKPIDLNNAYVSGLDANEDILSFPGGIVFQGNTGGSIRNVTLKGAKAFEITGPGKSSQTSLLVQNTVVAGMTTNVGSISGFGLYFGNIIQFVFNKDGISYSEIGNLLLNNQAWLDSNEGTFEKFTGSFDLIEKVSGFSTVNGSDIAIDVSSNPTVGSGVLQGTVFSGTTTAPSGYIKKYTTGSYTDYNFTNSWTVNCPGIPKESDDLATANLYFDTSSVINVTNTNAFKLPVNTKSVRLFRSKVRASPNENNSIQYHGNKSRAVNIFANFSFTATGGSRYSFSIYKNGTIVEGTEAIFDVLSTNQRQTASVIGTVNVIPGDYIEIYVQKTTAGNEQFLVTSYNLIMN